MVNEVEGLAVPSGEIVHNSSMQPGVLTGARTGDFDYYSMRLVLLPKGHKNTLMFDRLKSDESCVPLTLKSHKGYALALCYPGERDYHGYKYIEVGMAPASSAVRAWYDGTFITLEGSSKVLDISFWKYEEGNTVNFVKPPGNEDPRNLGGGRSFELKSDGSMCCTKAPHLVLGVKNIPMALRLVKRSSKNAIKFEHNLSFECCPLTLRSHPGKALALKNNGKVGNYKGYLYIEVVLDDAEMAARASFDGEFVILENDTKVLDVSFWKYVEGNTVNFVSAPLCCCAFDVTKQSNGGRSFIKNDDGTFGLKLNPGLVLGVSY